MGVLLHLVQRGGDLAGPQPAQPLLAVPNVTAHPSTATNFVLFDVALWSSGQWCKLQYPCLPPHIYGSLGVWDGTVRIASWVWVELQSKWIWSFFTVNLTPSENKRLCDRAIKFARWAQGEVSCAFKHRCSLFIDCVNYQFTIIIIIITIINFFTLRVMPKNRQVMSQI